MEAQRREEELLEEMERTAMALRQESESREIEMIKKMEARMSEVQAAAEKQLQEELSRAKAEVCMSSAIPNESFVMWSSQIENNYL